MNFCGKDETCAPPRPRSIVFRMTKASLLAHLSELRRTVSQLNDPLPPAASDVFNRLLGEARKDRKRGPLVSVIPDAPPDVTRAELLLWAAQLETALRPAME
jgi:hypothetical protein